MTCSFPCRCLGVCVCLLFCLDDPTSPGKRCCFGSFGRPNRSSQILGTVCQLDLFHLPMLHLVQIHKHKREKTQEEKARRPGYVALGFPPSAYVQYCITLPGRMESLHILPRILTESNPLQRLTVGMSSCTGYSSTICLVRLLNSAACGVLWDNLEYG